MRKYLELFNQGFDSTLTDKVKVENWPFVGYDPIQDSVRYTEIQKPMIEPANNEIWYTTVDGLELKYTSSSSVISGGVPVQLINSEIIQNVYSKGYGKLIFSDTVTLLRGLDINPHGSDYYDGPFGSCVIVQDEFVTTESNIKTITLPKTITQLDGYVFIGCTQLESIEFLGTIEEWNNISKDLDKLTIARYDWSVEGQIVRIPATYVQCTDGQAAL